MSKRKRASVIAILSLGLFATSAACVRVYYLKDYGRNPDLLWDSRNITIWAVVECNTGIIAGNLPCFNPLFRSMLSATYGSRNLSRRYGTGQHNESSTGHNTAYRSTDVDLNTMAGAGGRLKPDDVSEVGSAESQEAFVKLGGIMKITQVNVAEEPGTDASGERMPYGEHRTPRVVQACRDTWKYGYLLTDLEISYHKPMMVMCCI